LTADPQWLLERLGGGLFMDPTRVDLAPAALTASASELDFGIQGDGLFVVNDGRTVGPDHHRLTRDGRFALSARGELVTAADGHRVLDRSLQPIRLDPTAPVKVNGNGDVIQSGAIVSRIALRHVPDAGALEKLGDNLYRLRDGGDVASLASATGSVRQNFTEASAVDPIQTMTAMLAAAKAAQSNLKMMQYHDQALGQAINTFGRVA
ncbi:MAG: hypothetical protein KJO43_16215, partial [Phycisphaerae bacterium]|nr:hypothetical protein [Phycisphaerae bacterium]